MCPKKEATNQLCVFQSRLEQMIDMDHPMVRLSERINCLSLEKKLGEAYIPDKGRPALPTCLMSGLHYLKGMYALSDERVRCDVVIPGTKGKRSRTIRKFMKRRNAIEPIIGHMKSDHGMDRNWLKGED